ncbi:MAG: methyltransferase domain-containing protein [Lapillicoccus sp.]
MLHVVSDPHGHLDELVAALQEAGLLDAEGAWAGGRGELWFLGDFFDRGPDGVGIVDLVMRLQPEAAQAGGRVGSVLGNHEVLAVGMHRFGDTTLPRRPGALRARSFARSWVLNGGEAADQRRLTDNHLRWLRALPALALVDGWLLLHSDTDEYLGWGDSLDTVNAAVRSALDGDLAAVWELWRGLTDRFAFREEVVGEVAAQRVLSRLGGRRLVHGHSIIATLRGGGVAGTTGPHAYAGGLALAVDGGLYAGGPLLVVELDRSPGTTDGLLTGPGRALTFGSAAGLYERYRPGYPEAVADLVLGPGSPTTTAVEIGAGTGKATRLFAARRIAVTAVEPDPDMIAVLRRETSGLPVTIVTSTLEGLHQESTAGPVDLLYAAAAWHWTDPGTRWRRAATLLREGGVFACFGGPIDLVDPGLGEAVTRIRSELIETDAVPERWVGRPDPAHLLWPGNELLDSPWFDDVTQHDLTSSYAMDADDFVGLLSTISAYLLVPEPARGSLLRRIRHVLPDTVEVRRELMVHRARRNATLASPATSGPATSGPATSGPAT